MHHSEHELPRDMRKTLGIPDGLGPTGKFPEGKLAEHDEGEI